MNNIPVNSIHVECPQCKQQFDVIPPSGTTISSPVSDFFLVEKEEGKEEINLFWDNNCFTGEEAMEMVQDFVLMYRKIHKDQQDLPNDVAEFVTDKFREKAAHHPLPTSSDKELDYFKLIIAPAIMKATENTQKTNVIDIDAGIMAAKKLCEAIKIYFAPVQPKEELRSAQEILNDNKPYGRNWEDFLLPDQMEFLYKAIHAYHAQFKASQQTGEGKSKI